jgi:hypothetical protein
MIPSTNTKLLVAEDWKKIYQSFRNADFQSYDFETLRRTMIQYLRENYPEDFNDFIDSSEYVALIDLIAYLGQNLSFRVDLNARENFLETAERRDSVLRLAQLISYVPKRNVPSNGFLKLVGISTTDSVVDANRINLANTTISWNDSTNADWYQQFITVINSAMPGSFVFGKPYDRGTVDGIFTEQYRISSSNTDVPVFSFLKNINGANMNFEVTSCTFSGSSTVYEEPPSPGNAFSLIWKNDNQGYGSSNTGFFTHFRQGTLGLASFSVTNPVPNEIIGVNTGNINDTDVWLWQLDGNANYSTLWNKVSAITGNNIIYNSLSKNERNIYSVTSRDSDQIDLNFADGAFGNLPKGEFRLLYRQSNGSEYSIKPEQMNGIIVQIPYVNKIGQSHTLSLTLSLQYTVSNSSATESNASIRSKAPQVYYTQNRMVTAEDYNIAPLSLSNDILKIKSINRVTSGLSKYFDLSDVSSKYGQTNIFATDGMLYKNSYEEYFDFEFTNSNEVYSVVNERLGPIISSTAMRSFYLDNFERFTLVDLNLQWKQITKMSGQCSGYFETQPDSSPSTPQSVGSFTTNNLKYVSVGSMIKFLNQDNTITWATVTKVVSDGSNRGQGTLSDGTGPIVLSTLIASTAQPIEVIPKYKSAYSYAFENEIVNLCRTQRNFGLTINNTTREWSIILDTNLNSFGSFDLFKQGDKTNTQQDSSWLVCFNWNGKGYRVRYRITDYIFESEQQTAFYIDSNNVNYDYTTNTVIKDKITVLSINTASNVSPVVSLGKDYLWQVDSSIIEPDGYVEPKKVKVSFYDYNNAGQIEDPDTFENIVGTGTNYIFFKTMTNGLRTQLSNDDIITTSTQASVSSPINDQLYYFSNPSENVVKKYSTSTLWTYQPEYSAYLGRNNVKFQYIHNSGETRRVDPSKSNIMDLYLLTNRYDLDFRTWLSTGIGTEPLTPTSQSLEQNYASGLENIKTISDEIVFQPVKYKILFGSKADINLQATFKAVKNNAIPISDNEIKTRILETINNFFALENWEFGQSFYFSELVTYVMNEVSPYITNFVVVPKINNFGSLYEVACLSNEIFISGATVNDIQVINAITASQLNTTATIVTSSGS